jgi:hypothetical protein
MLSCHCELFDVKKLSKTDVAFEKFLSFLVEIFVNYNVIKNCRKTFFGEIEN